MNTSTLKIIDQLNRDLAQKQARVREIQDNLKQAKQDSAQAKFVLDNFMVQQQMQKK